MTELADIAAAMGDGTDTITDGLDNGSVEDIPTPLDLSALTADSVPTEAVTPDHTRSRERRSWFGARQTKDKGEERPRSTRTRSSVPRTRPGQLVEPLTQFYTTLGVVMLPFDATCGSAVVESAEGCAQSLDALAQQNDAVRRALLALTQAGAWTAVLVAHGPIFYAVLGHHGPPKVKELIDGMGTMFRPEEAPVVEGEQQ